MSSPDTKLTDSNPVEANPAPATGASNSFKRPLPRWLKLWSSYPLAFWTLVFMAFLTWRGTMAQREIGLLAAQTRYFESWLIIEPFWPSDAAPDLGSNLQRMFEFLNRIAYPLPGGSLLMTILAINLLGGVVRIFWQWNWNKVGALTGHLGVLILLAAAAVSYLYKREGYLSLTEGQVSSVVQAYAEPVIQIRQQKDDKELVPWSYETKPSELAATFNRQRARAGNQLASLNGSLSDSPSNSLMTIDQEDLPFRVEVLQSTPNAVPVPAEGLPPGTRTLTPLDGVALAVQQRNPEAERNLAGALVEIHPRDGSPSSRHLLFESSAAPAAIDVDGQLWWIDIRPKSWQLPFAVRLESATSSTHPGTQVAASYESQVTRLDPAGAPTAHRIYMNHPLRTGGFALFQAKMSKPNATGIMSSTFEVVDNPSDKWPEFACWVIAAGLFSHFLIALVKGFSRRINRTSTPTQ